MIKSLNVTGKNLEIRAPKCVWLFAGYDNNKLQQWPIHSNDRTEKFKSLNVELCEIKTRCTFFSSPARKADTVECEKK